MSPTQLYRSLYKSPADAAALIVSGSSIMLGVAVSQPRVLLQAIAERAEANAVSDIRLYCMLKLANTGETVLRHELRDRIKATSFFYSGVERALNEGAIKGEQPLVDFLPSAFSQIPHVLRKHIDLDFFVTTVAPMDDEGFFNFGTNLDISEAAAQSAKQVIVEVNPNMPRTRGHRGLHISDVNAIVEDATPLIEVKSVPIRSEDRAISRVIAGLIDDGACLQMGIGAVPEAVCAALHGHKNLGIHTELMAPGLVSLIKSGVIDNSLKTLHPGKSVFTFAMGERNLYDFIHENDEMMGFMVDYVNDPRIVAQNDNMVSVNATTQVSLDGACNSEWINGQHFSGSGGQLDFVRGVSLGKNSRSIIACHSTARSTISRIVPKLEGPVTVPRNDTQIIVTEFGYADLRGKSLAERAKALIGIAHPDFQEGLERAAFDARTLP
jgi:itaconate CoA-transferase